MSKGKVQFTGHASHTGRTKRHFWSQRNDWLKAKDRELRLLGRKLLPCCMRPGPYIILSRWPYVATSGQGSSAVAVLFNLIFHQWFLATSTAAPGQKIHEDPRVRHTTPHLHPHLQRTCTLVVKRSQHVLALIFCGGDRVFLSGSQPFHTSQRIPHPPTLLAHGMPEHVA